MYQYHPAMYKPNAAQIFRNNLTLTCLVLCLWMPKASRGQQSAITVQLFLSESLGQTTIADILRTLPEDRSVTVMVRGLLPGDKPLNRTIRYWQTIMDQSGTSHGVQIDPVAFSDVGITQFQMAHCNNFKHCLLSGISILFTSCLRNWFIAFN